MAEKFYDITPRISERLGVFPGDQRFERDVVMAFKKGHHLDLSKIKTTVHLGAHADAPSHYHADGDSIEKRPLGLYMGLTQVFHAQDLSPGARVELRHLRGSIQAPRVLIGTGTFPDPENWNSNFSSLAPEFIEHLAQKGVKLVGIDTPSVDPEDSKDLEAHQTLFRHNLAVLEGLVLKDVPEGLYTMVSLPLPIEGADASPVRAVLLPPIAGFPELA